MNGYIEVKLEQFSKSTIANRDSADFDVRLLLEKLLNGFANIAVAKKIALYSDVSNQIPLLLYGESEKVFSILRLLINDVLSFQKGGIVCIRVSIKEILDEKIVLYFDILNESEQDHCVAEAILCEAKKAIQCLNGEMAVPRSDFQSEDVRFNIPLKLSERPPNQKADYLESLNIILFDSHSGQRQSLQKILISWKCEVYTCSSTMEMNRILSKNNGHTTHLVVSLSFDESSMEKINQVLSNTLLGSRVNIILLHWMPSKINGQHILFDDIITLLEKPIRRKELYDALANSNLNQTSRFDISPAEVRVLIAEDNPFNQSLITSLLQDRNIINKCVGYGYEVLDDINQHHYDLLLIDIHLPDINGLQLVSRVRSEKLVSDKIPIIAFTGDDAIAQNENFVSSGFNDILQKPICEEALDKLITTWLPPNSLRKDEKEKKKLKMVSANPEVVISGEKKKELITNVITLLHQVEFAYRMLNDKELVDGFHQLEGLVGYFQHASYRYRDSLASLKLLALSRNDDFYNEIESFESVMQQFK